MTTKTVSTFIIVLAVALGTIFAVSWGLLGYWNSQSQPTTYIIIGVERNMDDGKSAVSGNSVCNSAYITIVKDPTTDQISHKCGNLGKPSAVISVK